MAENKKEMIYALVARNRRVIADFTEKSGSFESFSEEILKTLGPDYGKFFIDYESCQYMYYKAEQDDNLTFLILVETGYKRDTGFALLSKMRSTFLDIFSEKRIKKAKAYTLSSEFKMDMKALIDVFSVESYDKTDIALENFGELKETTTQNLAKLIEREDKLDDLLGKADEMGAVAIKMKKRSVQVKRKAILNSLMAKIMLGFIILVF